MTDDDSVFEKLESMLGVEFCDYNHYDEIHGECAHNEKYPSIYSNLKGSGKSATWGFTINPESSMDYCYYGITYSSFKLDILSIL